MRSWQTGVVGTLLLAGSVAYVAAAGGTDPHALGVIPIGIATGAVVRTPRPRRPWIVAASFLVGSVATAAAGFPWTLVLGSGLAGALPTAVASTILAAGIDDVPSLRTDVDLRRYLLACACGGLAGGTVALVMGASRGTPDPLDAAIAFGCLTLVSLLAFVPAFLRLPRTGTEPGPVERAGQWSLLVVATPTLVLTSELPALVFVVVPILAWGAFRLSPPEAVVQLVGVVVVIDGLTALGLGPFADIPRRFDVSPNVATVTLCALLGSCAIIAVPLMVRLGEYVSVTRTAARETELVRRIVDSATGVAIIGTDHRGRITVFNPGAERLLGYRPDEVQGRTGAMFHTPHAVARLAAELGVSADYPTVVATLIARGTVASHIAFVRKDGVERTHSTTLTRLTDEDDEVVGFLSTSEDITDELAVERALREALDVERRAVERLREVDAVKDAFVSTVSHELRTPITSMLGYLELLGDGSFGLLEARQLDAVLRVSSNSGRLLALIDDLLTLSRVSEHGFEPSGDDFDLGDAVDAAYALLTPSWAAPRRLDVRWTRPACALAVHGDREMVERLVVNLLSNAVKFTPDGGSVRLAADLAGPAGRDVVLEVVDTGIGIPADEQNQLFTRFFRSRLAQDGAIPGSGLGLSISRTIVEKHGGSIVVGSTPGHGTTVRVELPRSTRDL